MSARKEMPCFCGLRRRGLGLTVRRFSGSHMSIPLKSSTAAG